MIIAVANGEQFSVGQRVVSTPIRVITDRYAIGHADVPFVVLREATEAEWTQDVIDVGGRLKAGGWYPWTKFYEISVD